MTSKSPSRSHDKNLEIFLWELFWRIDATIRRIVVSVCVFVDVYLDVSGRVYTYK